MRRDTLGGGARGVARGVGVHAVWHVGSGCMRCGTWGGGACGMRAMRGEGGVGVYVSALRFIRLGTKILKQNFVNRMYGTGLAVAGLKSLGNTIEGFVIIGFR